MGELMYHDWDRENGDAAYAAYKDVEKEIARMHAGPYADASRAYDAALASQGKAAAEAAWNREIRGLLEGSVVPPGLAFAEFVAHPGVLRYLRMTSSCLDCAFAYGMTRAGYTRELHRWTEAQNVKTTISNLESPEHFESGEDGESAARTYWVPIWALLFSMVGAVVHLFKMAFTVTEYVQRRAFQAVGAADSLLARRVVGHSRRLIALGILALSLFIYFSDNRVTGTPTYVRLHQAMWASQPVVGAVAAHWTINAQGLVYPFTRKFRPAWLDFDRDPMSWMPSGANRAQTPGEPLMDQAATPLPEFQTQLLKEGLRGIFGEMNDEVLAALMPRLEWVEVAGGEVVVQQGGTDRDLYIVICGRLRAYGGDGPQRRHPRPTPGEGPHRRALSDITRGETIGEVSFITGAPRNATVVATRDSVLVRISRPSLDRLLADHPQIALSMSRLVIARLRNASGPRRGRRRPTNLCLLPVTPGVDVGALGEGLVAQFPVNGEALLLTSSVLEARLDAPGIANVDKSQGERYRQLTKALDELESRFATVVYAPDADLASEWSQRCLRMADRVLLVADAAASPEVGAIEAGSLGGETRVSGAEQVLVLLHGKDRGVPSRTAEWLDRRPAGGLAGHVHIRPALERDVARLARTQSSRAIGLVLCGGGARCFAHLGVYKALQEAGIQVDHVGGSGMGAVMGALIALDAPADELIAYAREAFTANPTGDVSLMPITVADQGAPAQGHPRRGHRAPRRPRRPDRGHVEAVLLRRVESLEGVRDRAQARQPRPEHPRELRRARVAAPGAHRGRPDGRRRGLQQLPDRRDGRRGCRADHRREHLARREPGRPFRRDPRQLGARLGQADGQPAAVPRAVAHVDADERDDVVQRIAGAVFGVDDGPGIQAPPAERGHPGLARVRPRGRRGLPERRQDAGGDAAEELAPFRAS